MSCGKPEPKTPDDCALDAGALKLAEQVELNGAAVSEECLALEIGQLEQCGPWLEVKHRWERRWADWQACP